MPDEDLAGPPAPGAGESLLLDTEQGGRGRGGWCPSLLHPCAGRLADGRAGLSSLCPSPCCPSGAHAYSCAQCDNTGVHTHTREHTHEDTLVPEQVSKLTSLPFPGLVFMAQWELVLPTSPGGFCPKDLSSEPRSPHAPCTTAAREGLHPDSTTCIPTGCGGGVSASSADTSLVGGVQSSVPSDAGRRSPCSRGSHSSVAPLPRWQEH